LRSRSVPIFFCLASKDRELYESNWAALLKVTAGGGQYREKLAGFRKILGSASQVIFSEEMKSWFEKRARFQGVRNSLTDYLLAVETLCRENLASACEYPQIRAYLKMEKLSQGLDPGQITLEMNQAARRLIEKGALSRQAAPENKEVSTYAEINSVMKALTAAGLDKEYANLSLSVQIRKLEQSIDSRIFEELTAAEHRIAARLAVSPDAKRLYRLYRILEVYEKTFALELTRKDVEYLYNNRHAFNSARLEKEVADLLAAYGFQSNLPSVPFRELEEMLSLHENYYNLALLRDKKIADNALGGMKAFNQKAVILITGGFHTPAIERRLSKEGISFCTITPAIAGAIDSENDRKTYLGAMNPGNSPLKKLIERFDGGPNLPDSTFQLQVPSRLPTAAQVDSLPAYILPLSRASSDAASVDFLSYMMTVTGLIAGLLGGQIQAGEAPADLTEGEKKIWNAIYPAVNSGEIRPKLESRGRVAVLFPYSDENQMGFETELQLEGFPRMNGAVRSGAQIEVPDLGTLRLSAIRDRTAYDLRLRKYEKNADPRVRIAPGPTEARPGRNERSELRVPAAEEPEKIQAPAPSPSGTAPAEETSVPGPGVSFPAPVSTAEDEEKPVPFSARLIPSSLLIDFPVLLAAVLTGLPAALTPYVFLLPVGLRLGYALSLLFHEWFHVTAAQAAGQNPLSIENILGGNTLTAWFRSLFPLQPLVAAARVRTADAPFDGFVRHAGWAGSAGYAAILVGSLALTTGVFHWIVLAMLPGAVITAARALVSDLLFPPDEEGLYCCGNQGVIARKKRGDRGLLPARLEKMLLNMGKVTKVRGEQAAGRVLFGQRGILRKRVVNPKRRDLSEELLKHSRRAVFFQRLLGNRPASNVYLAMEHYRYGTSSAPAVKETHPHQWIPEKKVPTWILAGGKPVRKKIRWAHVITHNGDFDDFFIFGRDQSNFHIGKWLEHVLHTPHAATGDSPKIAGMIDLLKTQGSWYASVRLAYQLGVANVLEDAFDGKRPEPPQRHSAKKPTVYKNTAPSARELTQWADIFETVFRQQFSSIEGLGLTDLNQVPQVVRTTIEVKVFEVLKTRGPSGAGEEHLKKFSRETVKAFFDNNLNQTTKVFMAGAKGSFGLVTAAANEPGHVVISARAQPMSIGFHPGQEMVAYASESAALKVPLDDEGTVIPFRFDLDQVGGEIADLSLDGFKIYSESLKRELTKDELAHSGRIIEMTDNPLTEPLATAEPSPGSLVDKDIREIPAVLKKIRKDWQN